MERRDEGWGSSISIIINKRWMLWIRTCYSIRLLYSPSDAQKIFNGQKRHTNKRRGMIEKRREGEKENRLSASFFRSISHFFPHSSEIFSSFLFFGSKTLFYVLASSCLIQSSSLSCWNLISSVSSPYSFHLLFIHQKWGVGEKIIGWWNA